MRVTGWCCSDAHRENHRWHRALFTGNITAVKKISEILTPLALSRVTALLPWLFVCVGLIVTYVLQNEVSEENRRNVEARFEFRGNELTNGIKNRLLSYEQVLVGTRALFTSSQSVERDEFHQYVTHTDLQQNYPGIQGIGYAKYLAVGELDRYIRQMRGEGYPDFTVHPEGIRDVYTAVNYIEPFNLRNQRAFGYDMYADPVSRMAMQRAADEDQAIASGKVRLVQEIDPHPQNGFFIYLPVYRNGVSHATQAERQRALSGWVYATFRMRDLMYGIVGEHFGDRGDVIAFDIYDGDTPSVDSLLYDFNADDVPGDVSAAVFHKSQAINIGGHQWTVVMRSLPGLESQLNSAQARLITVIGIVVSALLGFIVWLLLNGRARAALAAREMTRELWESEAHTQRLNRALQLLSECNVVLVRAEDEHKLLSDICGLIVERGGYLLAWVGFAEHDAAKTIRPVVHAGHDEGYLNSVRSTWDESERGRGPSGTAIRTGATVINHDYLDNPSMTPWREAALKHGHRSSIALPLLGKTNTLGVLTIYSTKTNAFSPEEVALLEELAGDIAYGIEALRTRAGHKQTEEQLNYLAHHDPLTQLPNRLLLRDRFDQAVAVAQRKRSKVAVLFLDLDNFKLINDSLGHKLGDELLRRVVARLLGSVRDTDTVSRQGGDEFAVLITDIQDPAIIGSISENIIERVSEPIEIEGSMINTTFSIGISVYPNDGIEFDTLIKKADSAMYHAKESGRNAYRFYTGQMNNDTLEQMQLQTQLRSALNHHELLLHYQPQVDIVSGEIVGFEALVRWQHPNVGMISPAKFIPLAERSGIIIPIGDWVLNEACRQARLWLDRGHRLVVAVNLSAVQFKRGNLLESVTCALERSQLPAELLELELTESILLQDMETVVKTLDSLKAMGIKLSIDDFGTGYSSLAYLKRLSVDKLKIDQSFVRSMAENSEDAAIVRAIIQLGHTLQLSVIAEGVETDAQLAYLGNYGCDEVQGYLFSCPIPEQDVLTLLDKAKQLSPAVPPRN